MDTGLLVARLFLGLPFIVWGYQKLRGGEARIAPLIAALGVPDATALAYLVGLCEMLGGLAVLLGYPVRTVGVLLGLWCLLTGYLEHRGNPTELMKNVTMAGGFFALAATGGGGLALFGGAPGGLLGWLR